MFQTIRQLQSLDPTPYDSDTFTGNVFADFTHDASTEWPQWTGGFSTSVRIPAPHPARPFFAFGTRSWARKFGAVSVSGMTPSVTARTPTTGRPPSTPPPPTRSTARAFKR
eukprot:726270-Rhodomonas_salina.2